MLNNVSCLILSRVSFSICLIVASAWYVPNARAAGTKNLSKTFDRLQEEAEKAAAKESDVDDEQSETSKPKLELATFGNGCFWCTEAVFEELYGVHEVISGYTGGRIMNPTYKQVCTGLTGHAEVIHLRFDPTKISYAKLLEAFWRTHDPTTLNRQGPDVGTQYRSAVFYHNDEQKELASHFKKELNKAHAFRKPIVTEVTKFTKFFPAESYHQDYFELNGRAPYCRAMISPKLSKFRRVFRDQLKKNPANRPARKGD